MKACEASPVAGYKVTNVRFVICDGKTHPVDSSDYAFEYAAIMAFKQGKVILYIYYVFPTTST